jgi:hypothetical protein
MSFRGVAPGQHPDRYLIRRPQVAGSILHTGAPQLARACRVLQGRALLFVAGKSVRGCAVER